MADRDQPTNRIVAFEQRKMAPADPKRLLQVERMLREHGRSVSRTYLPTLRAIGMSLTPERRALLEAEHREALDGMLANAATVPMLEAIREALEVALHAEPNECVIEASLAALIDTRVKLPHNLPIYLEALIFDLLDEAFPPAVVAAACQKIRREKVWLPEISEVLATCRETLARYQDQRRRVEQALADRRQAERWLAQLSGPDPIERGAMDSEP